MVGSLLSAPACLSNFISFTPALTGSGFQLQVSYLHTSAWAIPSLPSMPLFSFFCLVLLYLPRQLKCLHLQETTVLRSSPLGSQAQHSSPHPTRPLALVTLFGNCLFTWTSSPPGWEPIESWVPGPSPGPSLEEVRP